MNIYIRSLAAIAADAAGVVAKTFCFIGVAIDDVVVERLAKASH